MLWLVRHGESEANSGQVTSEFAAIRITPKGHSQAVAVAEVCQVRPDHVVLSRYLRARQTSEPLIEKFPGVNVIERPVEEFTYLSQTRCLNTDITQRQPLVDAYWKRMDPNYRDDAGSESFGDLCQRTNRFLAEAREWTGLTVVFTHEQFIRAIVMTSMYGSVPESIQMQRFFPLRSGLPIPNGAIVRLDHRDGRWWFGGVDDSHLSVE